MKAINCRSAIMCLVSAVVLGACAVVGTNFDPKLVDQLKPYVTTRDEAERLLGKPNDIARYPNGTVLLQWSYFAAIGGINSHKHAAVLFDADGVMIRTVLQRQGQSY